MADDPATYLDKIMREKNISNAELGRTCGVSPQAARHWRLGVYSPKPSYARLIAAYLKVPRHLIRPDLWDPPRKPAKRGTRPSRAPPQTSALSDEREENCAGALALPFVFHR